MNINDDEAKAAGGVGGVVTAGGIGAYASTLSAAEMTEGLAILGGGSMAAGLGVVAFVPLVAFGAIWGASKLLSD